MGWVRRASCPLLNSRSLDKSNTWKESIRSTHSIFCIAALLKAPFRLSVTQHRCLLKYNDPHKLPTRPITIVSSSALVSLEYPMTPLEPYTGYGNPSARSGLVRPFAKDNSSPTVVSTSSLAIAEHLQGDCNCRVKIRSLSILLPQRLGETTHLRFERLLLILGCLCAYVAARR